MVSYGENGKVLKGADTGLMAFFKLTKYMDTDSEKIKLRIL